MSNFKLTLFLAILPAGCGAGDAGDDFSNNLFTDLAPLLALFGERVTMQFMSQSLGWLDNIILAMAPLGIMTIIVSAIRVGGPSWLKSIIGRGRENLAAAEVELMSSTSDEVCELWNNHEIVRCMGSAPITEFICLLPRNRRKNEKPKIKTIEFENAIETKLLEDMDEKPWLYRHGLKQQDRNTNSHNSKVEEGQAKSDLSDSEIYVTRNTKDGAPNISLNSHRQLHPLEFYFFAMLGIVLQVLVLWYACYATYYLKYPKDGKTIKNYAAPCTVIGTGFLVIGLLLCSHVVESSTEKKRYQACPDRELRIIWLQKTQTVSDQVFDSSAIFAKEERRVITTSRRGDKAGDATTLAVKTVSGTIVSICGFVVQFVGLRQMHWSVSVVQLGAVLAMTGVRAWVRRGLATPPSYRRLPAEFELEWFVLALSDYENAPWWQDSTTLKVKDPMTMCIENSNPQEEWNQIKGHEEPPSEAQLIVMARRDLGHLAGWRGPAIAEAISVAKAIEITMDALVGTRWLDEFVWCFRTKDGKGLQIRLKREYDKWKAYSSEIEAALSLGLFSVSQYESERKDQEERLETFGPSDDGWLRTKGELTTRSLRTHGWYTRALHRDISWWVPNQKRRVMMVEEYVYGELKVKNHRVIGGHSGREAERRPAAAREPGEYIRFTAKQMIEFDSDENYADNREDEKRQLASESHDTLKSLYALGIFSAFVWATTKTFHFLVHEDAKIVPSASSDDSAWKSFTVENSWLSNMARDIESTGIGSLEDVYLSILPPLSAKQMLPQVTAIIELVREHAKQDEEQREWDDATRKYRWLWKLAKTFPPTSIFAVKATAVLMEYLGRVIVALEFAEDQQHRRGISRLRKCKDDLEKELESADPENLERLKPQFKRQERARKGASMVDVQSNDGFRWTIKTTRDSKNEFGWTLLHHQVAYAPALVGRGEVGNFNDADLGGWTPLHYACQKGNVDAVQLLIRENAEIEARNRDGVSPLHCAATSQETGVVSLLVEAGAAVDVMDLWGSTPLQWAIIKGHEDAVQYLWRHTNKRLRDRQGRTALHYAAKAGRLYLERLPDLKSSVDIDARDIAGWTPLHFAAASSHHRVVSQLVRLGPEIEAQEEEARTPLLLAAENGHEDATRLLVELGANLAAETRDGWTSLHLATKGGNAAIAELLIDKGVKIDSKLYLDVTLLHLAAEGGHEAIAKLLITKGAKIEAEGYGKYTPLTCAAKAGHDAVVGLLIKRGANVNTKNVCKETPLHKAAEGGHEAVVKTLIDNGAVLDAEDQFNKTPLHLAVQNRHEQVAALLIEKGADKEAKHQGKSPLHEAISTGHRQMASLLIEQGAEKESKNHENMTPLQRAVQRNEMAELLIKAGADQQVRDNHGRTLLHLAFDSHHWSEQLVKLLIQHGADIEAEDGNGQTPLHSAARCGNVPGIKFLIESGAKKEASDNNGKTPLEVTNSDEARMLLRVAIQVDKESSL